ncbi:helix-turn-helix transcriptional regulator [Paenibacillus glacialis]|uniref:DNA-binding transcriptional regulator n=1 Tax=Paenibacillus glacialis TaxID=494026 RepID=A0A168J3V3_9BACL|nr:YafY family protein [Paenibacillus glacialis]OAB40128.1 DNA-binding transcriptional regulator [Paenibacillus glacialis]
MKIDRLLAMTIVLLNRERVSAKELADRFEVSTKTIYRDMETLNQSGIPIVAHQGTSGGFEIMEQYTIARQFLTLNEINTMVSVVKGITGIVDDSKFASLLEKVKALLSKADTSNTEQSTTGIIFDFNPWGQSPAERDKVNILKQAIEEARKVRIQYLNMNGKESERVIEPSALILKGYVWYLHAYCTLRNDFRVFRLSRIHELKMLMEQGVRRETPTLDGYVWESEWSTDVKHEMILNFHQQVRYRILDSFDPETVTVLEDGSIQVKAEFVEDEWFYGMLLSYGEHVKVEQPTSVADEVVRRAQRIMERYVNVDR